MSNRVTIKSIAQDLGISHMTVSRALSDHPSVQPKTRARVLQRAKELGYVKSAAAKAMRGDAMKIVGLLLPNITNEFYAHFANALALACREHSYQLIIHLTNDSVDTERRSLLQLREVQALAIVMVPAPGRPRYPVSLLGSMKIIQLIRERQISAPAASVLVDDHTALHDAVIHLASRGHKSIAYIGGNAALSSGRHRLRAFRAGLKTAGLSEDQSFEFIGTPSIKMGFRRSHCR